MKQIFFNKMLDHHKDKNAESRAIKQSNCIRFTTLEAIKSLHHQKPIKAFNEPKNMFLSAHF